MRTSHICFFIALLLSAWLTFTPHLQAASTIQFGNSSYTVAENNGAVTLTVQRQGDLNTEVGVEYATTDGTATNGLKFTGVSGTLAFATGEINKPLVVPILNEGFVEGPKTFQVVLSNPTFGAVLGTRTNASVQIADNDFGIQFQFASRSVMEDDGMVVLGVVRGDDGVLPVTVDFFTTDLTAESGLDYSGATNTLSFAPQERLKFVPVPILNNTQKQPNRTFRVTLASPVGATLGSQRTVVVTILDNDQGFQFDASSYSVAEDAGVAMIGVLRGTDDTNSTVTVDFATSDLGATNGLDYTGITNTLAFAPGEVVKLVTIPILNNGIKQATRNFRLTLTNPTSGGALGLPTTSTVSILDNHPGVGFEFTHTTNTWGHAGASVAVLRGNDWALGPITVDYATGDLTAKDGQDYQAVSGTLQFQENETIKCLTIPLLRDRPTNGPKAFRVTLSNATGGALLGTSATTVNIVGANFTLAPPFDTALTIRRALGFNTLTWAGGGLLQRAGRPTGPWETLTAAKSPTTVQSLVPTAFYRVTRPRPVNVYIPSSYDGQSQLPLVILLHGFGGSSGSGDFEESYMKLGPLAEARGFFYCHPEAPVDQANVQFWNATDGCCDLFNSGRDDAGYLRGLIDEISRQFAVDRKRIYLVGHSNGGFMAYGMACQFADVIAGIASLAGNTFLDPSRCAPSQPVNILQIQGTADVFFYYGAALTINPGGFSSNMPPFPGTRQTVQSWAAYNGAGDPVTDLEPSLNLDSGLPGLDTVVTRYTNYPPGGAVELWTINGGMHYPALSPEFSPLVIDWLLAHPKP